MRGPLFVALVTITLSSSSAAKPTAIPTSVSLADGFVIPAPRGLEKTLVDDAKDGVLDTVDFISAALLASGVAEGDIPAERARLVKAISGARERARTQRTMKKRGERLLAGLHDTVLRRYVENQSRVDAVIATSEFNCLSSAVLYVIAADGLVDKPRGMMSLTHAFVRADVDGAAVDVETTSRNGFAVDRRKLVTREYLRRLGVGDGLTEAQRLKDLQNPQEVPPVGLIAGLYSNSGVMAVRQGDLEAAAVAFDRATRLSTGELRTRVANWRAALLNNAVSGLISDGRAADARRLLVIALDGATGDTRATLQQNMAATATALAEEARAAGRWSEAVRSIDEALGSGGASKALVAQLTAVRADLQGRMAGGDARRCRTIGVDGDRARCLAAVATDALAAKKVDEALDVARQATGLAATEATLGVHFNALLGAVQAAREAQRCGRAEELVHELLGVAKRLKQPPRLDGPAQMASCYWNGASAALKRDDLDAAATFFARAAVHLPRDAGLQKNRAEVDLRRAASHARAGRCDEARPLVRRAAELAPDSLERGRGLLEHCANERSSTAAADKRWADAVVELRRGLLDAPDSTVLADNLGRMLHNVAVDALNGKRCDDARALLPDLERAGRPIVDDIKKRCPR